MMMMMVKIYDNGYDDLWETIMMMKLLTYDDDNCDEVADDVVDDYD